MFESTKVLQERISPQGTLEVIHGSHIWTAKFEWNLPLSNKIYNGLKKAAQSVPKEYLRFLQEISNGCLVYYDLLFGQWGFKIYSLEECLEKQNLWKYRLGPDWQDTFVAFAETRGEEHVLLFDHNKPSADNLSCAILEGNPLDTIEYWPRVSRSFHEWLDHLITAQGAKYWEWK